MIIHDVEQNSDQWFALRAGIPTASEFSKLITTKGKISTSINLVAYELAAEKYVGGQVDSWDGNKWTERGKELEPLASSAYCFKNDCDVETVGFVTDDKNTMGCSPDRFVGEDGMIEIKCLMAKHHVKEMVFHKENNTSVSDYYHQVQAQMMICERKWCDLVFYHPDLPLHIVRHTPDLELWKQMNVAVKEVIKLRDKAYDVLKGK